MTEQRISQSMQLITPHGDCKHRLDEADHDWWDDSLPLMGIVNGEIKDEKPEHENTLITPHGDCKPYIQALSLRVAYFSLPLMGIVNRSGSARSIRASASSLPLMGIVNLKTGSDDRCVIVLITPHGDCKPPSFAVVPGCCISHYPSWGL